MRVLVFIVFMLSVACSAYAKRLSPPVVPHLVVGNVEVRVSRSTEYCYGPMLSGGIIEIFDVTSKELVYWLRIYAVTIDESIEKDVQDVRINNLVAKGDVLTVTNELDMVFEVDLSKRTVVAVAQGENLTKGFVPIAVGGEYGFVECPNVVGHKKAMKILKEKIQYAATPRLAIDYCQEALKLEPDNGEIHFLLSGVYKDMENIVAKDEDERTHYRDLSKMHFDKAIELGFTPPNRSHR